MNPKVSVVRCADYTNARKAVTEAINNLGGVNHFAKSGDRVLLKPNLLDPFPPENAVTTHPSIVRAVIEIFQDAGADVWVGDASGGLIPGQTSRVCQISGIKDVIDETGAVFRNFQDEVFMPEEITCFQVLRKTRFAKAMSEANLIVNLPKLKTHGHTFFTGAIKNCLGCIHPGDRQRLHKNFPGIISFSRALVDVYSFVKPGLNIMDAVVGMEGDGGPSFGSPRKVGLVIASTDGVALDAVSSRVIGYHPMGIPSIKNAHERNLGMADFGRIDFAGEKIDDVLVSEFKLISLSPECNPHARDPPFKREYVFDPRIINDKCVRCGDCVVNCPVGAIQMGVYPEIDLSLCIHCYCCSELCGHGAFMLDKRWLKGRFAPYVRDDGILFLDGREYEVGKPNKCIVQPSNLNPERLLDAVIKENPEVLLLYVTLKEEDLNEKSGEKLMLFFDGLRSSGIEFKLMSTLPPCLFGMKYKKTILEFDLINSCQECPSLFSLREDGMTKSCSSLGSIMGPKLEYMRDRAQINNYFNDFYQNQQPFASCGSCFYHMRGICDGICKGSRL